MSLKANINKYYAYNLFTTLTFWLPIWTIYFLNNGLSFTQIMLFTTAASISQIIFEIPSGVFADHFGRKTRLIISTVLKCIYIIFIFFGEGFWIFTMAWVIFGVSRAFESGSTSAFIYDTLKDLKREKDYKKVEGIAFAFTTVGFGIGSLVGGFLAKISLETAIISSLFSFLIALMIAFSFKEPKHHKKLKKRHYFRHLKKATEYTIKHPKVKWLIIFFGVMFAAMVISHRYSQPYMQALRIDVGYFGVIYFVWLLVAAAGAYYAHYVEKKIGEFYSLLMIPILLGIAFITRVHIFFFGVIIILLDEFVWGFVTPVVQDYINKRVASHHRATVLSLSGFFQSLLLMIFAPIFGYIADVFAFTTALFIEGVIVLIVGVPLVYIITKKK